MSSLNKVQLIGNLTANPEIRETANGTQVATFSLATNRVWKDQQGQKQEQVEFTPVVLWDKLAGIAEQYLSKGKKVYVEGRLQTKKWDDDSGVTKYKTEVIVESLIMLSGKSESSETQADEWGDTKKKSTQTASKPKKKVIEEEISIDDIPF